MSGTVHQLKVTLLEITPPVWRRVHVPSATSLYGLHAVLQVAMGWEDAHLWELAARWERYGGQEGHDPHAVTVGQVLPEVGAGAGYTYDFGDFWQHVVEVEKIHRPAPRTAYPRCSVGRRACPPEDCGGPEGYYDMLKVLRSRKGWRYRELRENGLHKYDPAAFDREAVNRELSGDPQACRYRLPAPWSVPDTGTGSDPLDAGQDVDHLAGAGSGEAGPGEPAGAPVNGLTTLPPPGVDEAAQAVRDALAVVDTARAVLGRALRAEQAATGVSANELADRVHGAMSRPLVLRALKPS